MIKSHNTVNYSIFIRVFCVPHLLFVSLIMWKTGRGLTRIYSGCAAGESQSQSTALEGQLEGCFEENHYSLIAIFSNRGRKLNIFSVPQEWWAPLTSILNMLIRLWNADELLCHSGWEWELKSHGNAMIIECFHVQVWLILRWALVLHKLFFPSSLCFLAIFSSLSFSLIFHIFMPSLSLSPVSLLLSLSF